MTESLITKHLDLWTSAIEAKSTAGRVRNNKFDLYGIKKLRELILELAVRGKLIPQDSADEPASTLLERIEVIKNQLTENKVIKRYVELPQIEENEKPYSLPTNWEWARIGHISNYGICDKVDAGWDGLWVLELEDIEKDTSKILAKVRAENRPFKSTKNKFQKDDVLYGKLRPYLNKVVVADEDGVCSTEIIPFHSYGNLINSQYLRLTLQTQTFITYADSSTHGMNLPRLGTEKAQSALIPVAPIKQQSAIIEKVDELMTLCDQLEQQTFTSMEAHTTLVETLLATLTASADADELAQNWNRISEHFDTLFTTEQSIDLLKQTILQLAVMGKLVPQDPTDEPASMLLEKIAAEKAQLIKDKKIKKEKPLPPISDDEKPFELPQGWEWCRLSEISAVGTGATPSRSNPAYWEPQVNWVTSGETGQLFVNDTNEKVSFSALKETNVTVYPVGTLIIAMYGQGKTRGQITELLIEAGTNQACAAIQLINSNSHHRQYIKSFFLKAYDEVRSAAAGGAQPNLNVGKISNTVIPIPPLSEQLRIVEKINRLSTICEQLQECLRAACDIQHCITDEVITNAF